MLSVIVEQRKAFNAMATKPFATIAICSELITSAALLDYIADLDLK